MECTSIKGEEQVSSCNVCSACLDVALTSFLKVRGDVNNDRIELFINSEIETGISIPVKNSK